MPGPLTLASGRTFPPSATSIAAGGAGRRPATSTAGASNSAILSTLGSGRTASGAATAAPIADSTVQGRRPLSRSGGNGGGASQGTRVFGNACPAVRQHRASAPEETAAPPSPQPLPTDRIREKREGGGGRGDKETHPGSSEESSPTVPREPTVGIPYGAAEAPSGERAAALAMAILVACLRRPGPLSRMAAAEQGKKSRGADVRETQAFDGGKHDVGHKGAGKMEAPAAAAAPKAEPPSSSCHEKAGLPPPPPPSSRPKGDKPRRYTRSRGNIPGAAGAAKSERDAEVVGAPRRRSRGRKRSLSWRGRNRSRAAANHQSSDAPGVSDDRVSRGGQGSPYGDRGNDRSDEAEVSRYILDRASGNGGRGGGGRRGAPQGPHQCRRAGGATPGFPELERLGAVSRAPGLLESPNQLLQELGVVILECAVGGLEGEDKDEEEDEEEKGASVGRGGGEQLVDTTSREVETRFARRSETWC